MGKEITTENKKINTYGLGSLPCISHQLSISELYPDKAESFGHPVGRCGLK